MLVKPRECTHLIQHSTQNQWLLQRLISLLGCTQVQYLHGKLDPSTDTTIGPHPAACTACGVHSAQRSVLVDAEDADLVHGWEFGDDQHKQHYEVEAERLPPVVCAVGREQKERHRDQGEKFARVGVLHPVVQLLPEGQAVILALQGEAANFQQDVEKRPVRQGA